MTIPAESQAQDQKPSDKELNFRRQEEKFQREIAQERAARLELERKLMEMQKPQVSSHEDDDDEPYVDKKKLNKTLEKFGQQSKQETQSEIQKAVNMALEKERQTNWLKGNSDFHDVLQHAEKLALLDPELADSILSMPEGFERQKLVYKNIKALGLHKPREEISDVQKKVNANQRSPYYQPSGVASSPYSPQSDFSPSGQKNAYDKMKELQKQLRL